MNTEEVSKLIAAETKLHNELIDLDKKHRQVVESFGGHDVISALHILSEISSKYSAQLEIMSKRQSADGESYSNDPIVEAIAAFSEVDAAILDVADTVQELNVRFYQLNEDLSNERLERKRSEELQTAQTSRLERIAKYTLAANWIAAGLSLVSIAVAIAALLMR